MDNYDGDGEWPIIYPKAFLIECYESYEVRFQPGLLPPAPQEVALVYDFEGAGIPTNSNSRSRVVAYRVEEDKLRVVASPRIPKPCTIRVSVEASGLSEPQWFSLNFYSPMEYIYHKMRHNPHHRIPISIPKSMAGPLFSASLAYVSRGGVPDNLGPLVYDLKQQAGIQAAPDSQVASVVLGDDSSETFENFTMKTKWIALRQQLLHQYHVPGQTKTTTPTDDSNENTNEKLEGCNAIPDAFIESLKEQTLFKAIATTTYSHGKSNWLHLQKGDEVYVVDCAQGDRWYGISSNTHGYFLPAHVIKADKVIMYNNDARNVSQISVDDGFHSRTVSDASQTSTLRISSGYDTYVTMQSVLEALGNNLITSPQSKTPPSSSSLKTSSPSLTDVANAPPTRDHIYDTIRLPDTSQTSNSSTVPQQQPTPPSSSGPSGYIYDTVPLRSRQQSLTVNGESHYAVPRPVSNTPGVSPRTRRRGSQPVIQHHTVNTSVSPTHSPSLDRRCSNYFVPRSASRSSISPPQSSPPQSSPPQSSPVQGSSSNKHRSHYDVPNPTNSICVSPPQSSPTQSPSWSSNDRRSHYDVPPRPLPATRRPPSEVVQQQTPTTVVTRQELPSSVQMRRSSSDSTDTVRPATPPPIRPRPSPNVSRRQVCTLDRSSGLNMSGVMSELRARTSTMSTTGNPDS